VLRVALRSKAAGVLETASDARAEDVFQSQLRGKTAYNIVFFVAV
jgi:hypothetical protein